MTYQRKQSVKLRKLGYSYNYISKKIGVSKSTLSYWLRFIPYKPNKETIEKIKKSAIKSAIVRSRKRIIKLNQLKNLSKKQLGALQERDLFLAGIGLYWGEGRKFDESVSITNSDEAIIKFFIFWLNKFCLVPKEDLRAEIHIYPDNNLIKTLEYWKKITKFKDEQFYKTQIDDRINKRRKKYNKLEYGTIHIFMTAKHQGVRSLHRKIMFWIKDIAGVV